MFNVNVHTLVTLQRAGDVSFGSQFCPGSTAEYKCQTTEGSLLWEIGGTAQNHIFHNITQPQKTLGIFLLRVDGVSLNGMALAVNSTAVVSDVQPSYNGTVLKCAEHADPLNLFSEEVLRVAGI